MGVHMIVSVMNLCYLFKTSGLLEIEDVKLQTTMYKNNK